MLCLVPAQGQDIIEAPAPGSGVRLKAGMLFHRSYSNISQKVEVIDDYTRIRRTPSDSAPGMKAGFLVGAEVLLGKGEKFKGVFGLNLIRSGAAYHSSFTEEGPTSRAGYTHMLRATELEYRENYWFADFQAGMRHKLFGQVYLTSMLVFSKPLITKRESDGYVLTTYSVEGSTDTESTVAYLSDPKKKVRGESNLSFRFRFEYQFNVGDSKGAAFLFRNIGLISTMPWWGVGFAYAL